MLRSTFTVSFFTLLSRILGFVRDILVAKIFGSGVFSDAYFVAFRIPNLLRSIFAEGALTSAFVPTFTEESKEGHEVAQSAFTSISSFLFFVTLIVSILGIIFSPQIVDLFAPGFKTNPEARTLCIKLTMIMMPYIIFVSFVALLNGALNSYGVYGASAKAQVYMNATLIIGGAICLFVKDLTISTYILSSSVIAGGIVQVITQIPALSAKSLKIRLVFMFYSPAVRKTIKLMLPAIFGAAIYQLTILTTTMFASLQEVGSVSWLFYADRIIQLPIGVFSIALASVLLPHLSKARVNEDQAMFHQHLLDSLRYSSFILIPIIGFIVFFSGDIVSILFQRGAFDSKATMNTALAVQLMSFGIWFTTCHSMITRAFVSKNDTKTPTLIGLITLISTVFFIILFSGNSVRGDDVFAATATSLAKLIQTPFSLGFSGLALSSSLSSAVGVTILIIIFSFKEKTIRWGSFAVATVKTIIATALTLMTIWYFIDSFGRFSSLRILNLVITIGIYSIVYSAANFVLGTKEFMETLSLIRRLSKHEGNRS